MDQNEAWTIDDDSDSQSSTLSSSDGASQPAPVAQGSRLRPAGAALTFVPYADWEPEQSYENEPIIRYNIEWKLFAKNRGQAGESELDVVISPRKFWKHVLQPKVAAASAGKPWKEEATKLVLSVTDRKTGNITKRFPKLDIDWPLVTRQLCEWSKFLDEGKKITITATFYYAGRPLNGHEDVPDEFRRLVLEDERELEEREQREKERSSRRKRTRRDSDLSSSDVRFVQCHPCVGGASKTPASPRLVFQSTPLQRMGLPREDAVRAYSTWQQSQVSTDEQKDHYAMARDLTLAHGYDLNMLAANQERMYRFYVEHGVLAGVS
ncbi:hypothetical protein CGMCC3_g17975 [Colletotrichum fructicola]|nr:uncharacterized protein CGMCC3_g17975 [Colletotrichum fructicola]KAE9565849.1 hypothetical protein CGMCC3_g17975 [Colletotrichum fructicola]